MHLPTLQPPINYFPVSLNPFSFKTGLIKLSGTPKGHEQNIFQIDSEWSHYRQEKLKSRKERLSKYVTRKGLDKNIENRACSYIVETLTKQHPTLFTLHKESQKQVLHNTLSGESIEFDNYFNILNSSKPIEPAYENLLDALCCQLQEDLSIIHITEQHDKLVYLHLCFPNYWSAESKIGKCFSGAHKYVPAMETINKNSEKLNKLLKTEGPFERFTWGITTDKRLNHHPNPSENIDQDTWYGRQFSPDSPLYLRIERQVTAPFSKESAYMFSIRTYFVDLRKANGEQLRRLITSIETMSENILKYKGLAENKELLIKRLSQLAGE